jgi:gas vesicle structural protein
VIGIELVTIDARIVIASIDSYLRFAEAVNRLDLTQTEAAGLRELREGGHGAKPDTDHHRRDDDESNGKGKLEGAKDRMKSGADKLRGRD